MLKSWWNDDQVVVSKIFFAFLLLSLHGENGSQIWQQKQHVGNHHLNLDEHPKGHVLIQRHVSAMAEAGNGFFYDFTILKGGIHPWNLTWNLKITQLKRRIIFRTLIFWVPAVHFPGCNSSGILLQLGCLHVINMLRSILPAMLPQKSLQAFLFAALLQFLLWFGLSPLPGFQSPPGLLHF